MLWSQISAFLRGSIPLFLIVVHKRKLQSFLSNLEHNCGLIVNRIMIIELKDQDRVIEMAWEDRTPFEAIEFQFGLSESQVIELMRNNLKDSSFQLWRKRVSGRKTKHTKLRNFDEGRHKCSRQRTISNNKISKR
jgi:uncharacterized protein (TIGR03643 family)